MQRSSSFLFLLLTLALSACTSLSAPRFEQGKSTLAEVEAALGPAARRWQNDDGTLQLAYPKSPMGTATFMAYFSAQANHPLLKLENVLTSAKFAEVKADMSMEDVEKRIGPAYAPWTVYFEARDELVWEWRYCDAWGATARFNVLFDGSSKKVRSTLSLTEQQRFGTYIMCGQEH